VAGFKRVYTAFPGFDILGNIESVNTIDIAPPANPLGAGTGVVCCVGEFERGDFNAPTQVTSATDLATTFGGLGYEYDGELYQYPTSVRSGQASDYWNGNGFIALRNKRFASLIICRVDNSAGSVEFNRLAYLLGSAGPYDMEPADTVVLSVDGGAGVTGTFNAAAGRIDGAGGTYPTLFVGGETITLGIDDAPDLPVTFEAGDQTLNQVIDRINNTAAQTVASDNGGELRLESPRRGYGGRIGVVSGTSLATLGLPSAPTAQVDTLTINSNTGGGDFTIRVTRTIAGQDEVTNFTYTAGAGDTVTQVRDGLELAALAAGLSGVTPNGADELLIESPDNVPQVTTVIDEPAGPDASVATTTAAVFTEDYGSGNVYDIDAVTGAEAVTILDALAGVQAELTSDDNLLRLAATTTPATGTLEVLASSTGALALGLTVGELASAASDSADSTIPAGTRLQDSTTDAVWVVMEDIEVDADLGGPYEAKVRPAVDDDTTPVAAAGDLDTVIDTLPAPFAVTNADPLSRLTAAQMDARYATAIDSTLDVDGVSYTINIIFAARSSANIGRYLRANALSATATGHQARKTVYGPPIGTSRATAMSAAGVGVGSVGREQRETYCFPGVVTQVPEIAALGAAGGPGFTDDGVVQVRSDGFYASVRSILPPEENAGQQLSDTNYGTLQALGMEDAYNKSTGGIGLTMADYIAFKDAGICAPRLDRVAGMVFQSDVTSVNPATQSNLVDNKRRYMGDFIIDSLSDIAAGYVKKLNTPARRQAFLATINRFLNGLRAPTQPDFSRIENFSVQDDTTADQRAAGFQIVSVLVRLYPSMDYIVFNLSVGTTVEVTEG
jgi:hypothetical protein